MGILARLASWWKQVIERSKMAAQRAMMEDVDYLLKRSAAEDADCSPKKK
jgi:hypothetical protein